MRFCLPALPTFAAFTRFAGNAAFITFTFGQAYASTAASPELAKGLWLSADKAAVIEFAPCVEPKTALCGTIVWDKDAGTPKDDCGLLIAKLKDWEDDAWRNGWIHDPRSKKNYKGVLRVKNEVLHMRAFIGTELLGETEEMTRVTSLPTGCKPKNASK